MTTIPPRWLLAALTLMTLAACDGHEATTSSPPATAAPTPPATTSPDTTTADPAQEVLAAYERAWEVFTTAMRNLDPVGLEAAYAGSALNTARNQVLRQQASGHPVAINVTLQPHVLSLAGDTAIVADTYINRSVELDPATGQPIATVTPQQVREQSSLQRQPDGTWKVTLITRFEVDQEAP